MDGYGSDMRRALELAERGWGRVSPNPLVGAVVRAADDWNHSLYGRGYTVHEILLGTQLTVPQVAQGFIQTVTASAGPVLSQQ